MIGVDAVRCFDLRFGAMKFLLFLGLVGTFGVCGCGTFSGAGSSALQNLEQGAEGGGRIVSPDEMGNDFGSYYE